VLGTGSVMYANERLRPVELPWTWWWLFWAALFAPAILATMLSAASTSPPWPRLKTLYAASVLFIIASMELTILADPHLTVIAVVVLSVSLMIRGAFNAFQGPSRYR
jgi:hypothetical protein